MNILIRVDSSGTIGTGHVTRCVALAHLLRELHHQVIFLCADLPGNSYEYIDRENFKKIYIQGAQDNGTVVHQAINDFHANLLVVDHYSLDEKWEGQFRNKVKVLSIDDLGRQHAADAVIDTNFHAEGKALYQDKVPENCEIYAGPEYAFFRKKFLDQAMQAKSNAWCPDRNVLVFFGGADFTGETLKMLKTLQQKKSQLKWTFLVSKFNRFLAEVQKLPLLNNVKILIDPENIPEIMLQNRYYFGSGGTITWERLHVGLPGVVISVADNQVKISRDLARAGYQEYFGSTGQFEYSEALEYLEKEFQNDSKYEAYRQKGILLASGLDQVKLKSIIDKLQR